MELDFGRVVPFRRRHRDVSLLEHLPPAAMLPLRLEESGSVEHSTRKRDTKRVGDISEAAVALALIRSGYLISKPVGENARYDLIADDGDRLLRVQIKTGRLRRGVILFATSSSHHHRGGTTRAYKGQIEFLAVFCPQTGKVYLIPEADLTRSLGTLRLLPTKNNMARGIIWASTYELLV